MTSSSSILPIYDSIFAVSITILAFSIPDKLKSASDVSNLLLTLALLLATAVAASIFWLKMRRLLEVTKILNKRQLALVIGCLILVVILPRLSELVFHYGGEEGMMGHWNISTSVNTIYVVSLLLVDGIILVFASSARIIHSRSSSNFAIQPYLWCQLAGFLAIVGLAGLEIGTLWFNDEYVYVLPFVLIAEELGVAQALNRWGPLKLRDPAS